MVGLWYDADDNDRPPGELVVEILSQVKEDTAVINVDLIVTIHDEEQTRDYPGSITVEWEAVGAELEADDVLRFVQEWSELVQLWRDDIDEFVDGQQLP
jgi:hypothetical protein